MLPNYTIEPEQLAKLNDLIPFSDQVSFIIPKPTKALPKAILHRAVMSIEPATVGMRQLREALKAEVCKGYLPELKLRDKLRAVVDDEPFFKELFTTEWGNLSQYEALVQDVKDLLNSISPTFCLSKWNEVTINLARSGNHSCCRTELEISDLAEVIENPQAIHNSKSKQASREMMLTGVRSPECAYCWKQEDTSKHVSHRVLLSISHLKDFYRVLESKLGESYTPTQVEIYSSSTCQLKCFYCGPDYSSAWRQELVEDCSYKLRHGKMFSIKNLAPALTNQSPFLLAYEKVIKEWYPQLTTLRFTGGEPLLATQLWKMLDYAIENPSPQLTISINSNLCVGDKRIERLIRKLNSLDGKVKEIWVHASGEAVGAQMEYIRFGSNYQQWKSNIRKLLEQTPSSVKVTIMNTLNVLCYNSFTELVNDILELRREFGERLVLMSFKYLLSPSFSDIRILPNPLKTEFVSKLENLIEVNNSMNAYATGSLTESEVYSLKRLIDHVKLPPNSVHELEDLRMFFKEYDRRRGTSFKDTFPELAQEIEYDTH